MYLLLALVAGAAVYSLLSIFAALRFLATRRPRAIDDGADQHPETARRA